MTGGAAIGHSERRFLRVIVGLSLVLSMANFLEARTRGLFAPAIRYGITESGYEYMNGGSQLDQRQRMERHSEAYNFKLVLLRPWIDSHAPVALFLANNHTGVVERITLAGPWTYLRLSPGTYTFAARVGHKIYILRDILIEAGVRQEVILRGNRH